MTTLLTVYISVVALLSLLSVLVARTGQKFNSGWVSFILLWPFALPFTVALFWAREGKRK